MIKTARPACFYLLFGLLGASPSSALEIEGFRLGMPLEEARRLAAERNQSLSNPYSDSRQSKWVSYVVSNDGPSISFCDNVLSSVIRSYRSNLHEFTDMLKKWTDALGSPDVQSSQTYISGLQVSSIVFRWFGQNNVRTEIAMMQFGSTDTKISYSYGFVQHPCRS